MLSASSPLLDRRFLDVVHHLYCEMYPETGPIRPHVKEAERENIDYVVNLVNLHIDDYKLLFDQMYSEATSLIDYNYADKTYSGFPWQLGEVICMAHSLGWRTP